MKLLLMPILFKEFRAQLRGSRAALLITIYVGLLLIALRLLYSSVVNEVDFGAPLVSAQIGQALFTGFGLAIQLLTVFIAPATTVNAVSSEHERRTFDMLLATPLSATQMLLGKLVTALAFLLLLILAVMPLFSIIVLFGGVQVGDLTRVIMTVLISAVLGALLGLTCSAITRQTYAATLLCYAILATAIGGTLFAANLWSVTHSMLAAPPQYVVANPLSAMAAVLASTRPPDIITPGTLQPIAILGLLTQGTMAQSGGQSIVLPIYRATWVVYSGLALTLFWSCLHLVQPRRRWRLGRTDLVVLVIALVYAMLVWLSRNWWLPGLIPPISA